MRVEDLTEEMIEMIDNGRATVWDGQYVLFATEKPVDAFYSDLAPTLAPTTNKRTSEL